MDAKDKIAACKAAMKEAQRLALELDAVRDARPKSPKLTGMPRSGNGASLDLQMEIIESAEKRFDKAREIALERLAELEDVIDELDNFEFKMVLYLRYIYGLKWMDVAERMHYGERTVRRIHSKALEEMNEKRLYPGC